MAIDLKLIDKLLADYKKPEDIIGEHGLLKQLTKAVLERAMQAEMTEHLGYEKHDPAGNNSGNSRNGKTTKALKGDFGKFQFNYSWDYDNRRGAPPDGSAGSRAAIPRGLFAPAPLPRDRRALRPTDRRRGRDRRPFR